MIFSKQPPRPEPSGPNINPADMDCESAALLRAIIRPLFVNAPSWNGLSEILEAKGYHLAFRDGQLCLTDQSTGSRICGLRFLGLEFRDLVRRMGRPFVVASGDHADGELMAARPGGGEPV